MFGGQGVNRVPLFHAHASFGEVHCVVCCTDARWLSALQGGNCHLYLRAELWPRRAQGPDGGGEADV